MSFSTNKNSVMKPANQNKMLGRSPMQYARAGGSLTKNQVKTYHNTKGKALGTTKGAKAPVTNPKFTLKKVGVANPSKTQYKK